jgi:hypothetical protein
MASKVKFGFQISPQDASGSPLGSLVITDAVKTQLVGFGQYITHTSAGTIFSSGTASWSFDWTAPAAGTGNVTFYGAFNITNNANNNSGDFVHLSTLTVTEDLSAGINDVQTSGMFSVYPNPAAGILHIKNERSFVPTSGYINDLSGRRIKELSGEEISGNRILLGDLPAGLYLMNIVSENRTSIVKFIKQ